MPHVKDPVCGMDVDPASAAGMSRYESQTYYFCSAGCQRRFETESGKYVGSARPGTAPRGAPREPMERHEPPHTTTGGLTAPKFGAAGSGGAELEPLPEAHDES